MRNWTGSVLCENSRMKIETLLLAILLSLPVLSPADEAVALSFSNLDNFEAPVGWKVAKHVEGDPNEKRWSKFETGTGLLTNGEKGKAGNLVTRDEFGDVEAYIEFMIPRKSNSGIYFQQCYEIQILDSYGKPNDKISVHDCGAVYERWDKDRDPKGYEGTIPKTNAARPPGQWQTFKITFRAPRFDARGNKIENARFVKVIHNGKLIIENAEVTGPTRGGNAREVARGPLKIQGDHGPVAFRKIELRPVKLD